MNSIRCTVAASLVFAGLIAFSGCSSSHEEHTHSHHSHGVEAPDHGGDLLAATQTHLDALATAISRKDTRAVHQHAEATRDVITKVPDRATPDSKAEVERLAHAIANAAHSAHEAAHDDDWAKAQAEVQSARQALKKLKEIAH